jgi:hypothetical protein
MTLNTKLAAQLHNWLVTEGQECPSEKDLDSAADRFLERWPRVKPQVLQYVTEMPSVQLHVRTIKPSQILDRVGNRIARISTVRRRWWQIGWIGSRA